MSISADEIYRKIRDVAEGAFKDGWAAGKAYAPAEFRKMAVQLESIAHNVEAYAANPDEGYSPATGKVLFRMQRNACEAVLVAVTQLTMVAVQKALNAIVKALKDAFGQVLAGVF
jgi:hypothetical protein